MQSLCALVAADFNEVGAHDYASLFLAAEQLGLNTTEELFRRVCFNVFAANNDDHTKNHTFLMREDGTWQLSPAYDVTYAYNPNNVWLRQHLMSVNGKFEGISRRDLLSLADQFSVPGARAVLSEVTEAVAQWPRFAAEAGISAARTAEVADTLREIRNLSV